MTREEISDLIYERLDYMYCDNCRYDGDDSDACEGCDRKSNGWGVSRAVCDGLARRIVKHGHWIPVGEYGEYECSVCHWPASRDSHDYHRDTSPYCRFCGAKMEGDENEID